MSHFPILILSVIATYDMVLFKNHVTPLINYVCMDILKAIGDKIFHVSTMEGILQNKYIVYSR